MLSKSLIKKIRLLEHKKYRQRYKCFIAEGPKTIHEFLKEKFVLCKLLATEKYLRRNEFLLSSFPSSVIYAVSERELSKISLLKTPHEALAVFEIPNYLWTNNNSSLLVLDNLNDPGNMGTILRIADWFGISTVAASHGSVDFFHPKVVQSSMGSLARVKVFEQRLTELIKNLNKTMPVYAATLNGRNIFSETLSSPCAFLLGSEAKGISPDLLKYASAEISIPSFSEKTDSLNVAVAAGIICAEWRRRQGSK